MPHERLARRPPQLFVKKYYYALVRLFGTRISFRGEHMVDRAFRAFSKTERRVFSTFLIIFLASAALMLAQVNAAYMVTIPAHGGSLSEGIVGAPKFINPLLAVSDADQDLTALVYSGLMRRGPNGTPIPDLAQSYAVSDDGLVYTFVLKHGLVFHDGTPLTSSDVAFTISQSQASTIRSDVRGRWDGVTVETPDAETVRFILKKPYVSFLDNTTLGILPRHIWEKLTSDTFLSSDRNIDAVGSGPYQIDSVARTRDGKGVVSYTLKSFTHFALGKPYIDTITLYFYQDGDAALAALKSGAIESLSSIPPESAQAVSDGMENLVSFPEQRLYGVFFNQTEAPIFAEKAVRNALEQTVDRARIIDQVFHGYATPLSGPIPPGILGYEPDLPPTPLTADEITQAQKAMTAAGWTLDTTKNEFVKKVKKTTTELHFTIATRNIPELKAIAGILKENWEQLGARVDIAYFDEGDLRETVIRPRKYDVLLFGGVFPSESALYSYWHSSQRNDPGYNITMYANSTTDKILSNIYSTTPDDTRLKSYQQFKSEIAKDIPAIFLYTPNILYAVPKDLQGISPEPAVDPSDRFVDVASWYRSTEQVWKIFAQNS